MRCLTAVECSAYLLERGIKMDEEEFYAGFVSSRQLPDGEALSEQVQSSGLQLKLPDSSVLQSRLVDTLFQAAPCAKSWVIWLLDWDVGGGDFADLWRAVRFRYGEYRWIKEVPCHLFEETEYALALGMARLAVAFGFDAHLISIPAALVVYTSHDDYMEVYTASDQQIHALADELAHLGIEHMS